MSLADLLGMAGVTGGSQWTDPMPGPAPGDRPYSLPPQQQPLTPDQINALPNVQVPRKAPAAPQQDFGDEGLIGGAFRRGRGIGNFLGTLGDILLAGSGHAPIYQKRLEDAKLQGALANFTTNPDMAIQQLMKVDPASGIALYNKRYPPEPDFLRELRAAGIDPASDQGQQLVSSRFGKQPSSAIQDYQYYVQQMRAAGQVPVNFAQFYQSTLRPQLQSPVMIPAGAVPVAQPNAQPALRIDPQTGQWEPER